MMQLKTRRSRVVTVKKWIDQIARFCESSNWLERYSSKSMSYYTYHIHHPAGRRARAKVDGESVEFGEWYVIPLPIDLHMQQYCNGYSIHGKKRAHIAEFGSEYKQFLAMIDAIKLAGFDIIIPHKMLIAIENYHKLKESGLMPFSLEFCKNEIGINE